MGSHTFSWAHPAHEVFVTGTFDNWSKSVKLEKHGDVFQRTVDLPAEKILYKFVVDNSWVTDHTAPQETDHHGNTNNILNVEDLKTAPSSHSFLSSVAPNSTSAAMASAVPLEAEKQDEIVHDEVPGAFPITPANELQQFSVNPIPATEGFGNPIKLAPGEPVPDPSTFTSNTVQSTVKSDPELQAMSKQREEEEEETAFGVMPIPASSGIGNPIKLAPGEPVPDPSTFNRNTVDSTVSNMRSATGAPVLPPVLTPASELEARGGSMFGLPSVGGTMIPESSLPMGPDFAAASDPAFTINSVGPQSTSAVLAGKVPIRERGVPEVVQESQEAAHVGPEASANVSAVEEKSAMEDELRAKVPEARGTASSTTGTGNAADVPAAVTSSQHAAHVAPEASASSTAVAEKSAMEEELKQRVPEEPSTSESGLLGKSERGVTGAIAGGVAAAGAAAASAAYLARDKAQEAGAAAAAAADTSSHQSTTLPGTVPPEVVASQTQAHAAPEASAEPEAVAEKSAMEKELMAAVPEAPSTSESGVLGKSEEGISGKLAAGVTAGAVAAGAAIAGGAYMARDKAAEMTGRDPNTILPPQIAAAIDSMNNKGTTTGPDARADPSLAANLPADKSSTTAATATAAATTSANGSVPTAVTKSQNAAHASPEASASSEAVREKSAMEKELQATVPKSYEAGEPAPTETAALSGTAPVKPTAAMTSMDNKGTTAPSSSAAEPSAAIKSMENKGTTAPSTSVEPSAAIKSMDNKGATAPSSSSAGGLTESAAAPPASAASIANRATEPPAATVGGASSSDPFTGSAKPDSEGLNAGAASQAQSSFTKNNALAAEPINDSRDVSPMSRPATNQTGPTATTGVESSHPPAVSTGQSTTSTPAGTPQKSAKRNSLFRNTPESSKSTGGVSDVSKDGEGKPKKKGFLTKLKEKLRS